MKDKLIVLYGGPSSERQVSFGTKDFFLELYKDLKPTPVEWTTDFRFVYKDRVLTEENFLETIKNDNQVVLISSHGEYVEDGYIQSLLEKREIPFTGSDSKSCELSMDKTKTQAAVKEIVKTIPTYRKYENLSFPFIAKPNSLGSSVGIYLINSAEDLEQYKENFTDNYIFQPYIKGRELSLGSVRDQKGFLRLYPTEIIPKNQFFDYEAKYIPGMSEEITPADIGKKITEQLIGITNKTHDKLGLGYYSRSDFILAENNELYYLETNSLPGMTKTSLVPQQLIYAKVLDQFKKGLLENLIS